jgi:hypothetical protein
MLRPAPNARHEQICIRLHEAVMPLLADQSRFRCSRRVKKVQVNPLGPAARPNYRGSAERTDLALRGGD